MTIKIELLRCVAAVAESGNLAGAAVRLNRSPSAVSMMLKQLEEHLGKPLFETDRKRDLSPLGRFVGNELCENIEGYLPLMIRCSGP